MGRALLRGVAAKSVNYVLRHIQALKKGGEYARGHPSNPSGVGLVYRKAVYKTGVFILKWGLPPFLNFKRGHPYAS